MADGQVVIQVKSNAQSVAKDFDRLDRSLSNTEKELKDVDRAADDTSGSLVGLKGAAGALVAAFATVEIAQFSKGLIDAASDAEETANKFNVVFRDIKSDAEEAANALAENFGLASDEAQKFLADTGDLLTGFGFTQESALALSTQLNQLAVDLASFTNVEGGTVRATEALTAALFGETEAAKALGIVITQDVVKAKVEELKLSGQITNQSDNEARAIATLQLAYEQSKNAIGDFARSQESFANQSRIAASITRDLKVALGEELLPLATSAVSTFNELAGAIRNAFAPSDNDRFKQLAFEINEASLELAEFTRTFNDSFLRNFDGLDATATPQFEALTEKIRLLKEEQAALIKQTQEANATSGGIANPDPEGVTQETYKGLTEQAALLKTQLQDLFVQGGSDTEQFASLTSQYQALTAQINAAKEATEGFKDESVESFDIAGAAADNFSRNAARALFEPWEEGETAADRFKQVALDTIADILAEFIAAELKKQAVALTTAVLTGGSSLAGGLFGGANAKGNAFSNGSVEKFANGGAFTNGIVSSPTTFPMSGGRTGLMGEAGPEAIMPLDRDQSGRLGVQVTQTPLNVNINNNAPVQIQTVRRSDNEFDIFIEDVNAALSDSRVNNGFSEARGRFTQSGLYGG